MELYEWQKEAYAKFKQNGYCGIVCASTGVGKTYFALNIFKDLKQKTLIVVPSKALMVQWVKELLKIGVAENDVGVFYGESKSLKPVTVATIHSISKEKNLKDKFSFVIFDEVHRYPSTTWKSFLLRQTFKYRLGLTATLEREDGQHDLLLKTIGPVVYNYTTNDAVSDDLLSQFTIRVRGIELSSTHKAYATNLDSKIKTAMAPFNNNFGRVVEASKKKNRQAFAVLRLTQERKKFYNNSHIKLNKAVEDMTAMLKNGKKIIVFGEYIDTADLLYERLKNTHQNVFVYYSGSKTSKFKFSDKEKKAIIEEFERVESGVLITVKALDEGLNITDIDVGVMVGYNTTTRQAVQRMGRILRKVDGQRVDMYLYYFKGTNDYWNVKNFVDTFADVGSIVWS